MGLISLGLYPGNILGGEMVLNKVSPACIAFVIIMTILVAPLNGASIEGTGLGATFVEAKARATEDLVDQISLHVFSTRTLLQSATSDYKQELFTEELNIFSKLNLLGVRYKIELTETKQIVVTAFLTEATLPLYHDRLSVLKNSIEDLENRRDEQLPIDQQKVFFLKLLNNYHEYEAYSLVVKSLDSDAIVPILSKSRIEAELDYLNILMSESDLLSSALKQLQEPSTPVQNQIAIAEAQIEIQKISQQLEENQNERRRVEHEQEEQQKFLSSVLRSEIHATALLMAQKATQLKDQVLEPILSDNPLVLIQQLEQMKANHKEIVDSIATEMDRLAISINERFSQDIYTIENAIFRAGEKVNGVPAPWAVELRKQRISLKKEQLENELETTKKSLEAVVAPQLNSLTSSITQAIKAIDSNTFVTNSLSNNVLYRVGTYDGVNAWWPLDLRITILDQTFPITVNLPFSLLTDVTVPDLLHIDYEDGDKFNQYLDTVEMYDTFFENTSDPFQVQVTYSISVLEKSSAYAIIPRSITVIRVDTGKVVTSYSIPKAVLSAKEYKSSQEEYNSFLQVSTYSVEMKKLFDETVSTNNKTQAKILKKYKLDNAKSYYRQGFGISLGFSFREYQTIVQTYWGSEERIEFTTDFQLSLSGYYTLMNSFYVGLGFEGHMIIDGGDEYPSYAGICPIVGLVYPIHHDDWDSFWKPFTELRFVVGTQGFETVLCIGCAYNHLMMSTIGAEFAMRVNLSGPRQGAFSIVYGVTL